MIHYPKDEGLLSQIAKDITSFKCDAVIRYVDNLNLNNKQLDVLYDNMSVDIFAQHNISETA